MKNFTFLLPILFLFVNYACTDGLKNQNDNSIVGKNIAKINEGKIQLTMDQKSINNGIQDLLATQHESGVIYYKSVITNIDNNYYLRSYSSDSIVTTTLLETKKIENNNYTLSVAGISCSSDACSSNNGCLPKSDKKSCTSCVGDCKKTVTAIEYSY